MARILVTGTLAIDYVATYPETFAGLPRHEGINLSIHLDGIERRFGGCAMNIAYNLTLLGHEVVPFAFVGRDFERDYAPHLEALGIDRSGIVQLDEPYSSHALIITDRRQNQFTGFYPGPSRRGEVTAPLRALAARGFDYAVLAPDVADNMNAAAAVMHEAGIAFLTDPGQGVTDFTARDSARLAARSSAMVVNEYEYRTLHGQVGDALLELDWLVVTLGADGASWFERGEPAGKEVAVSPAEHVDPTGCGDAFRGGFVDARLRGAPLRDAIRAGALVASVNMASRGSQCHSLSDYPARYVKAWNDRPSWLPQ